MDLNMFYVLMTANVNDFYGGKDAILLKFNKNNMGLVKETAFGAYDGDTAVSIKASPFGDSMIVMGTTNTFTFGLTDCFVV